MSTKNSNFVPIPLTIMKKLLLIALLLSSIPLWAGEKIIPFKLSTSNGLPDNDIYGIAQDPTGNIYLHSKYATFSYDGYSFRKVADSVYIKWHKKHDDILRHHHTTDNLGNSIDLNNDGDLIYHDIQSGDSLIFRVFTPQMLSLSYNLKIRVATTRDGHIWISVNGNGLFLYNRYTKQIVHIVKGGAERLIDSNYIVDIMLDHDDNLWVSQEHFGIVRLSIVNESRVLRFDATDLNERMNKIRMIRRLGRSTILVADKDGNLYSADGSLGNLKHIRRNGKNIISAATDSRGRFFLGTQVNGIDIDGRQVGKGRVDCILMDNKHRMWACGIKNGLMLIRLSDKGEAAVKTVLPAGDGLNPYFLLQDHSGRMWMASEKGVFVFYPDQLLRNSKSISRVLNIAAKNLYEDSSHTLWIGTANDGVYSTVLNQTAVLKLKFTHLTRDDGLPSNVIQFITESSPGCLFIGTNNGCVYYRPRQKQLRHFFMPDNPALNYCSENSFARLDDGTMVVGTIDGIVYVDEEHISKAEKPHPLALTNVLINGVSVFDMGDKSPISDNLSQLSEMHLAHDQNFITLDFSTFDYGNTQNINYSYRLEGYDRDWSEATHFNFATYKDLSPGTYTLSIRYAANNSNWTLWPKRLKIVVKPPLWATWWAIILYVIALLAVMFVIARQIRRTQALRQSVTLEKQMTEFKLRFFTNISHEFRTPLTLISAAMERIRSSKNMPGDMKQSVANMQRSVDNMMRLVNQLLEFRKMQNGKLSLAVQETDIVAFAYNIYMSFHDMAVTRKINYLFLPQKKEIKGYIDRSHFDKIVFNLLSNAFKYTPNGNEISLRLSLSDNDWLQITVGDTGIGISKDKQAMLFERYATGKVSADSIGIGLNLTQELVRVHHGKIRYEENPGGGSLFIVSLPINRNAYSDDDFMLIDTGLKQKVEDEKESFGEQYAELMGEPLNDKRVLVVEDNPDISGMLMQELGKFFHVDTAQDGQQAWEMLTAAGNNNPFDLVVTDVMMPRMDGFELVRHIRDDERLRPLPVVMLTALTAEEKQQKGLEVGADVYIAKPFSVKVLIAQIATLIHLREVMQRSFASRPARKALAPQILKDEKDKKFIEQLDTMIGSRLGDPDMSVDTLAGLFGMGRTTFYRRVRELTGKTPNVYINEARMYHAAELLKSENLTVSEVAYRVGINTPQYFAINFKKMFGMSPTKYQKGDSPQERV